MKEKKGGWTMTQIATVVVLVLYMVWEKNVQQFAGEHPGQATLRIDLMIILPILILLIILSALQYIRRKK
ncbi:hypothetical protein [Croceiramulus getboli]|nr:hypothetical protein P8624_02095 [Flavobacteriaceae bacterium YJPT1-3]